MSTNYSLQRLAKQSSAKFVILIFAIFLISTPSVAGNYYSCIKPAAPGSWIVVKSPTGRWLPTHNTANWDYKAVPGNDYFQRKNDASRRVFLKCTNVSPWGSYQADIVGNQDKCVKLGPATGRKAYIPSCRLGNLSYVEFKYGACYSNGNLEPPGVSPDKFVVPFDDPSYCPQGGTLRFRSSTGTYFNSKIRNADNLHGIADRHISCPAGEKYAAQTKSGAATKLSRMVFTVPENVSKMYFSASVKPTVHVTPFLSERLGFAINDSVNQYAGTHFYYPTSGPAKDIGWTAYTLGENAGNGAIFQDRWEVEVVPDFVQFGVPLVLQPPSGVTLNIVGGHREVVVRFSLITGSAPRTIVEKTKLEYCAPLKLIKGEDLQVLSPPSPTQIGTVPGTGKPAEIKRGPICKRGETRFSVKSKTPKNWTAREVSRNGKTIVCAKFQPRPPTEPDTPVVKPKPEKPVYKCRRGEKVFTSKKMIPRRWKWRSTFQHRHRIWCARPPVARPPKCNKNERQVRNKNAAPRGWRVRQVSKAGSTIWCARKLKPVVKLKCRPDEKRFRTGRSAPKGWRVRRVVGGGVAIYCAKPAVLTLLCPPGFIKYKGRCIRKRIECPRGTKRVGSRCVKKRIICPVGTRLHGDKCIKPRSICPKGTRRVAGKCIPKAVRQESKKVPTKPHCPRGTRYLNGRCIKG